MRRLRRRGEAVRIRGDLTATSLEQTGQRPLPSGRSSGEISLPHEQRIASMLAAPQRGTVNPFLHFGQYPFRPAAATGATMCLPHLQENLSIGAGSPAPFSDIAAASAAAIFSL